jgi:hypothetical protein
VDRSIWNGSGWFLVPVVSGSGPTGWFFSLTLNRERTYDGPPDVQYRNHLLDPAERAIDQTPKEVGRADRTASR